LDEAARLLEERRGAYDRGSNDRDVGSRYDGWERQNLENCEVRLNGLKDKLSGLERELSGVLEKWKDWLLQNRFDTELTPEGFDSFLAVARGARADLKSIYAMRRKLVRYNEYEDSINARIRELGAYTGLELDKEGLPAVFSSLKEALSLQTRLEASLEERRAIDFECAELETELATAVGSVRALCEESGADNEENFRAMYEEQALRSALEKRLAESRRTLEGIFACGSIDIRSAEFLTDPQALAEEIEASKLAIADCEKTLIELKDEVRSLEEQTDLIANDRLFALRQRNEILKTLAQKEFKRWLAVVLLKRFAEKATLRHEKNLEPEILRQARRFLSLMVGANWKIIPEERGEERDFSVALLREADGIRLHETQWSQGLAEQVGLSMRLATACRLADQSEPLPMMLDDVLSRFDESRQRGAVEALWRASEKLQVIFFTCHRSTIDMFQSRLAGEKDFSVVEISGDTFFKGHGDGRMKRSSKRR